MGTVWSARNEAILRDVAIKVMRSDVIEKEPSALTRFFNEARICGSIRHPGIVDVIDLGQAEDGSSFIVMELLEGEPLESVLQRMQKLTPLQILPIVADVARTIDLAHVKGVVHRDLKPANIYLHRLATGETVTKVLDFGISKVMQRGPFVATHTGSVIGSPAYMSPEQARGASDTDHRTDIYALGVILYQALSGQFPFDITNYNTLVVDILTRAPPPLGRDVPRALGDLVLRCLEKDPARRFAGAAELAAKLDDMAVELGGLRSSSMALSRISIPRAGDSGAESASASGAVPVAVLETAATMSNTLRRSQRSQVWLWAAGSFLVSCAVAGFLVLAGVLTKKSADAESPPRAAAPLVAPAAPAEPALGEQQPGSDPLITTGPALGEPSAGRDIASPTAVSSTPGNRKPPAPGSTAPRAGGTAPVGAAAAPTVKRPKKNVWEYD
jgi:serine/threonine-protein kinase